MTMPEPMRQRRVRTPQPPTDGEPTPIRNGDVILIEDHGLVSAFIAFGARRHYGRDSPHTKWTHVAIVYDASEPGNIQIAEATAPGGPRRRGHRPTVHRSRLEKYKSRRCKIVHMEIGTHDWKQVKTFLDSVLGHERYGWVTYLGLLLYDVTGTRLCLQEAGTTICSGLVCDALTRAGVIWPRPPYACTPADIDAHLAGEKKKITLTPADPATRPNR